MDVEGLILDVTPADGEFDRSFLERLGHPVLVCHGPEMGHTCPILKDGCEMVDTAHGIIFQIDLERPQHRAILKRYQEVVAEDVPIAVVIREGQRAITSFNRNWQSRMGLGGEGYLASPSVVAASALIGYMAPPSELKLGWNAEVYAV